MINTTLTKTKFALLSATSDKNERSHIGLCASEDVLPKGVDFIDMWTISV